MLYYHHHTTTILVTLHIKMESGRGLTLYGCQKILYIVHLYIGKRDISLDSPRLEILLKNLDIL